MVICMVKNHEIVLEVNRFDAFCRTITFTNLPFNMGHVRPKLKEL